MDRSGWAWPDKSPYAHYYVNNQSLCDRSAYFEDDLEDFDDDSPDNCKVCVARVNKYRRQKNKRHESKGPLRVTLGELCNIDEQQRKLHNLSTSLENNNK